MNSAFACSGSDSEETHRPPPVWAPSVGPVEESRTGGGSDDSDAVGEGSDAEEEELRRIRLIKSGKKIGKEVSAEGGDGQRRVAVDQEQARAACKIQGEIEAGWNGEPDSECCREVQVSAGSGETGREGERSGLVSDKGDHSGSQNAAIKPAASPRTLVRTGKTASDSGMESSDDEDMEFGPAAPPAIAGIQYAGPAKCHREGDRTRTRRRLGIDPKIVDDSSDDEDVHSGDDDEGGEKDWRDDASRAGRGYVSGREGRHRVGPAQSAPLSMLPVSATAHFGSKHGAYICDISLDAAGSRFLTASADSSLHLYDFSTMDRRLNSFRTLCPLDDSPLSCARFSARGGHILCAGAARVARVLDRDARPLAETPPGDMYIVDMAHTRGHIAPVHAARWLTPDARHFASSAADATVRLWDFASSSRPVSVFDGPLPRARQLRVIKLRGGTRRTCATAMEVLRRSADAPAHAIVLGCNDGSVRVADTRSGGTGGAEVMYAGGGASTAPSCVAAGAVGTCAEGLVAARCADDVVRMLDIRKLGSPVATFEGLPNAIEQTGVAFVGDGDKWLVTGTSASRRTNAQESAGRVVVFDVARLESVWEKDVPREAGSVVAVAWHPQINQVLYGCADGKLHALYDSELSQGGVIQCLAKAGTQPKRHGVVAAYAGEVYTPSSLAAHRQRLNARASGKRSRSNDAGDARPVRPPESSTISTRGPVSTPSFTKTFMEARVKKTWADEDPREALLKLDTESKKNPVFTAAYAKTQPETVLASKTAEEEEEEEHLLMLARDRKRRALEKRNRVGRE